MSVKFECAPGVNRFEFGGHDGSLVAVGPEPLALDENTDARLIALLDEQPAVQRAAEKPAGKGKG